MGLALAMLAACVFARLAEAADSAAILIYHRFGESQYPSTDIRLDQFEAHLKALKEGGYHVLPLGTIVAAFRDHTPLPDKAVAITIDDAYKSILTRAWPLLKAAGFPFTVFVATDPVDGGFKDYMSWDDIKTLAKVGVEIGAHTASHPHMPELASAQNVAEIEKSNTRFKAELGAVPTLFAYPYGEMSLAVRAEVVKAGYKAALGQHSGAAYAGGDIYFLPRFSLDEKFGDLDRLKIAAGALPLPVTDISPRDPLTNVNPPPFGFTAGEGIGDLKGLACYSTPARHLKIEELGARRVEIRLDQPFPEGRARINCTMPGPDHRWRWFGTQFYIKKRS